MTKYRVVAVEPKKSPYEASMSFEEIRAFAGGDVESVSLYDNIVGLVNEDGRLLNLPRNRHMVLQEKGYSLTVVGNFVVIKNLGSDFGSLSDDEVKEAKYIYRSTTGDETIFI